MHSGAWLECPSADVQQAIADNFPAAGLLNTARPDYEAGRRAGKTDRLGAAMGIDRLVRDLDAPKRDEFTGGGTTTDGVRMTVPEAVRRSSLNTVRRSVVRNEQIELDGKLWWTPDALEKADDQVPSDAALEMLMDEFQEFDPAEREKLRAQFRQMTPPQQWQIWQGRDDMGRLYRRQREAARAQQRAALYQKKQKKPTPAPAPAVGDGTRRYFDE